MRILPEGTGRAFVQFFVKYLGAAVLIFALSFVASFVTLASHYPEQPVRHAVFAVLIALAADAAVAFVLIIVAFAKSLKGLS